MKSNSISRIFAAGRDRRRARPACRNVEGNLPPVAEPGRQRQPDFAYDLSPELQCCSRFAPAIIGQIGPNGDRAVHKLLVTRRPRVARWLSLVISNANDRGGKLDAHSIDCYR
jgi:hypothetical protein